MLKNKRILVVFMIVLLCLPHVTVFAVESASVTAVKTYNDAGTHTLTLDGDIKANGCYGAIYVDNATELTINGTGTVHGLVCAGEKCQDETCGFSMAVFANNGSTITIDGGTYTQDSDGTDQSDLIYAARQSEIIINGGTFKSVTPQWTLNCKDNTNSTITVKGGRFYKFDPSNTTVSPAGQNEIVVPEGYKVVQDGDWYEVVVDEEYNFKKALAAGGTITLQNDIVLTKTAVVNTTVILNLNGHTIKNEVDLWNKAVKDWSLISVREGGNLTINGEGNLLAKLNDCYGIDLQNGGKLTINGGKIVGNISAVYVNAGEATINDGEYSIQQQSKQNGFGETLNCLDANYAAGTAKINAIGGTYFKFDPTKAAENTEPKSYVSADYKVVQDGDWYEVVCAHLNCTEVAEVAATYNEEGTKAHWVCDLCEKVFADEAATTEAVDLVIPKLAEVVDNNATVTPEAFDKALAEAGEDTTVVLPVLETEEVVNSVTVPVDSLETLANEDKELLIETSEVTLTLDNATLTEIVAQAGNVEDVTIEVVKVEEEVLTETQKDAIKDKEVAVVLSAQILVDGEYISDFNGGKVIVEVPFVPAENTKVEEYKVVYIADDGKVEEIPFKYVDGKIVLELEHFSEYAIVKDAVVSNEAEKDESPKTGSESIVVFVLMISILGLVITKKRK